MVTLGKVKYMRMLVLQGKCTENRLLLSFDAASFLPMFYYNGGLLVITTYKVCILLSLESIQVYGKTIDLGSKILQKP